VSRDLVTLGTQVPRRLKVELVDYADRRGLSLSAAVILALDHGLNYLTTWEQDPAGEAPASSRWRRPAAAGRRGSRVSSRCHSRRAG